MALSKSEFHKIEPKLATEFILTSCISCSQEDKIKISLAVKWHFIVKLISKEASHHLSSL